MTQTQLKQLNTEFTKVYGLYQKDLYSHAYYKVSNREVSKDLVQDTFMKTWDYLMKGGKVNTMKAFLYHILNNLIVDQYRKHKTSSLDVLVEKGFDPLVGDTDSDIDIFDGRKALLLIDQLPEKYYAVMHMRYTKDLSLEEMSCITKQPKNTIAVQVHRGLEKLKSMYHYA